MKNLSPIADFLFEVGILAKTPRSGFYFLGSGEQSVAEHINRVTVVGYVLSYLKKQHGEDVDENKILKMCLFHDLPEARTSDLNYVHQKYTHADEDGAMNDLAKTLPFGDDIKALLQEREAGESIEAKVSQDADQLELILSLKEQLDIGNERANTWIPFAVKRLKTKEAREIATVILQTPSDNWWFQDKDESWWVKRDRK